MIPLKTTIGSPRDGRSYFLNVVNNHADKIALRPLRSLTAFLSAGKNKRVSRLSRWTAACSASVRPAALMWVISASPLSAITDVFCSVELIAYRPATLSKKWKDNPLFEKLLLMISSFNLWRGRKPRLWQWQINSSNLKSFIFLSHTFPIYIFFCHFCH